MHGHKRNRQNRANCCTLKDIKPGLQARIFCHHSRGPIRQRLLDLGFVPQTKIEVLRRAPLGDPIECRVANYKVALRKSEAELIEVEYD